VEIGCLPLLLPLGIPPTHCFLVLLIQRGITLYLLHVPLGITHQFLLCLLGIDVLLLKYLLPGGQG